MEKSTMGAIRTGTDMDLMWERIRTEVAQQVEREPILASFLHATILNHTTLEAALSFHLANKLDNTVAPALLVREVIDEALAADPGIGTAARADLEATYLRDSACHSPCEPLLYFKGFHALQVYRVAHWLWQQQRRSLAMFLQHRVSVVFGVDIHPAAQLGEGILLDHATGIVIGETAVVEDNVSIMQSVTLGGTGKETGDRHPKIRCGVLIGAGSKVLGNIEVGVCAQVASGSVVLKQVPEKTLVAGVPAEVVGPATCAQPAMSMDQCALPAVEK
ncbi:serine O-acetyltransferase [Microbulbifer sp. 2205BS26-8]|uniref:serine O-acetyltransferase n=1 Tax=Microbulbifer sp. 2205BS26-8 TaxID=3064386 RepID=UPI00273E462B|nr:serine O-acetyltransferase [Microbulbifer sp. 2205BS26-8]MDP5208843.1 serine O-acetyltransferase [Microbulbifer sp. 2205BS26-8]